MFYKVELCFLQAKGVLALTLATCSLTSSTPGKSIDCSYEWADVTSYHIHHILHILGKSQVQKKREARDARLTVMVGAMVGPHHHFLSFVDTIRLWPFQSIWADKLTYDTYFIRMIIVSTDQLFHGHLDSLCNRFNLRDCRYCLHCNFIVSNIHRTSVKGF